MRSCSKRSFFLILAVTGPGVLRGAPVDAVEASPLPAVNGTLLFRSTVAASTAEWFSVWAVQLMQRGALGPEDYFQTCARAGKGGKPVCEGGPSCEYAAGGKCTALEVEEGHCGHPMEGTEAALAHRATTTTANATEFGEANVLPKTTCSLRATGDGSSTIWRSGACRGVNGGYQPGDMVSGPLHVLCALESLEVPSPKAAGFQAVEGHCVTHGNCVRSPLFPKPYPAGAACKVLLTKSGVLDSPHFDTRSNCDVLQVGAHPFSGVVGPRNVAVREGDELVWSPGCPGNSNATGWRLCLGAAPTPQPGPQPGFDRDAHEKVNQLNETIQILMRNLTRSRKRNQELHVQIEALQGAVHVGGGVQPTRDIFLGCGLFIAGLVVGLAPTLILWVRSRPVGNRCAGVGKGGGSSSLSACLLDVEEGKPIGVDVFAGGDQPQSGQPRPRSWTSTSTAVSERRLSEVESLQTMQVPRSLDLNSHIVEMGSPSGAAKCIIVEVPGSDVHTGMRSARCTVQELDGQGVQVIITKDPSFDDDPSFGEFRRKFIFTNGPWAVKDLGPGREQPVDEHGTFKIHLVQQPLQRRFATTQHGPLADADAEDEAHSIGGDSQAWYDSEGVEGTQQAPVPSH